MARRISQEGEPTTGRDVTRLADLYGLDGIDLLYAFGLSQAGYQRNVRDAIDQPVNNVALAILTKYYEEVPEALMDLVVPDVSALGIFEALEPTSYGDFSTRQFALSLGRNASFSSRVITRDGAVSRASPLHRLLLAIAYEIENGGEGGARRAVERLRRLAGSEARARGADLGTGNWGGSSGDDE